ncbi:MULTISPECIES: DUF4113 domain-containing protein [Arthrobacter]|uniref:DUF4113 domain-containing protein n=1 Tax=Arthrobacter terricola TaxID=2547396 RepID=A0A4R5K8Q3_9MICC|nr:MULTISPECIES: DUF4113 domain-containing protein [Arthrobacter]MBT8163571.1 DUF4113 domain-containing protein [Arthrobacter sp. GN70]TDF88585.1 DUF4113 domain-containing protein [Arthrobacter terricola]
MYSIDDSWLKLRGPPGELEPLGQEIRRTVLQPTGIPVRVAIGIKKNPAFDGVLDLRRFPEEQVNRILDSLHVTDLWGVAGRNGKRLAGLGIHTARELRDADPKWLRKQFSVVMERTVLELRGQKCIELETQPRVANDQLIYSRSFSRKITDPDEMHQVLSIYAQRVSARLRAQRSVAGVLTVWASTGWADEGTVPHSANRAVTLVVPSDDPIALTKAACAILPDLFPSPGIRYARAGVVLTGLRPADGFRLLPVFQPESETRGIGAVLDDITRKLGKEIVGVSRSGLKTPPDWEMKRAMLLKRCTTHWDELPVAVA